jgi:hypothetical protein
VLDDLNNGANIIMLPIPYTARSYDYDDDDDDEAVIKMKHVIRIDCQMEIDAFISTFTSQILFTMLYYTSFINHISSVVMYCVLSVTKEQKEIINNVYY